MTSPVIDLSHHNPTPDWAAIKKAGVIGVIHKATEGTSYKDPTLYPRAAGALNAGLKWSTYHFIRPGKIREQIDWYLEVVNPVAGERMCLDHEDAGVPLEDLEDMVAYLAECRPDVQIALYSGHLIKEQLGNRHSAELAKTSLWIAQYTTAAAPTWPTGTWPQWSLWQWTDKETVPGISQPVDGNRWNGTEAALLKWFGPAGAVAPPEPVAPPAGELVDIFISTPPGVRVSITVNGETVVAAAL